MSTQGSTPPGPWPGDPAKRSGAAEHETIAVIDVDALAIRSHKAHGRRAGVMPDAEAHTSAALEATVASLGGALDGVRGIHGRLDGVVMAFDSQESIRRERVARYRMRRAARELARSPYLTRLRGVLTGAGLRCVTVPGWEADDVCASVAEQLSGRGAQVVVVSPDADLLALAQTEDGARGAVEVHDPVTGRVYDHAAVIDRFGVIPESLWLYQALAGDRSDDIEGVVGIGSVRARRLCQQWPDIAGLLDALDRDLASVAALVGNTQADALASGRAHLVENYWLTAKRTDLGVGLEPGPSGLAAALPPLERVAAALVRAGLPSASATRLSNAAPAFGTTGGGLLDGVPVRRLR